MPCFPNPFIGEVNKKFTKEELIKEFSEKRLSKSPSMFDKDKLTWVNNRYIKERSLEDIVALCMPYLKEAYDLSDKSDEWINMLIATYHDQLSYGKEIVKLVTFALNSNNENEKKEISKQIEVLYFDMLDEMGKGR